MKSKINNNILYIILSCFTIAGAYIIGNKMINKNNSPQDKDFGVNIVYDYYNKYESSKRGFPFHLECTQGKKVIVTLSEGYLLTEQQEIKKTNDHYKVDCNQTIYWNYDNLNKTEIVVKFEFDNEEKSYILQKDEKQYIRINK